MSSDDMVKLTDEGIKWMVERVSSENFTVKQASRTYGITERLVQQLIKMYRDTWEFPKLNPSRDTRFYSNKNPGTSEFEYYLKREGVKHIPSRKGNPQTNGKLERL